MTEVHPAIACNTTGFPPLQSLQPLLWILNLPLPISSLIQILSLPLDTAKVRLQLQSKTAAPKYK